MRSEEAAQAIIRLQTANSWSAVEQLAASEFAREPADGGSLIVLGYARLQLGQAERAAEVLTQATRIAPEEIDGWVLLGEALRLSGRLAAAQQTFAHARGIDSYSPVVPFLLGETLAQAGDPPRALAAYQQAVQLDSRFAPAWYGVYRMHRQLGDKQEMQAAIDALRNLDPALANRAVEAP